MYRAIVCRGRQDKNAGSRQIADQLISFSLSLSFRGSNCFDIAFTGFDSLAAARCIFFPQSIVAAYLARDREQPKSDICYATFILSLFSRFFFFFPLFVETRRNKPSSSSSSRIRVIPTHRGAVAHIQFRSVRNIRVYDQLDLETSERALCKRASSFYSSGSVRRTRDDR